MDDDENVDLSPSSTRVSCGWKKALVGSSWSAKASEMKLAAPVSKSAAVAVWVEVSVDTDTDTSGCVDDTVVATFSLAFLWRWLSEESPGLVLRPWLVWARFALASLECRASEVSEASFALFVKETPFAGECARS